MKTSLDTESDVKVLAARLILCACLALAAIPFTATPAVADHTAATALTKGQRCIEHDNLVPKTASSSADGYEEPNPLTGEELPPICPQTIVGLFFDSGFGKMISRFFMAGGSVMVVIMIAKSLMAAVKAGAILSAAAPILASLIAAGLLFNIDLVAVAIATIVDGVGQGATSILPFFD